MDWIAPVTTLGGAVVGVAAALFADRLRWRRDDNNGWTLTRRQVYVDFLVALSRSHSDMRAVTFRPDLRPEHVFGALHQALDGSGAWQLRQALSLTAPPEVIRLAMQAGDSLASIRDVLIREPSVHSEDYQGARDELWSLNAELREAMRHDLDMQGPPDPEVEGYRRLTP